MNYRLIKLYPYCNLQLGDIIAAHNQNQYKDYPEFWEKVKEPEFKVGDWVKWTKWSNTSIRKIKSLDPFEWYGNTDDGSRLKKHPKEYRLATPEEIETHLIAEAKRRGFAKGVTYKNTTGKKQIASLDPNPWFGNYYHLRCGEAEGLIYDDELGQWAEIIKEEEIKIGEYVAKFDNGTVSFGCKKYSRLEVIGLYNHCLTFGIFSVHAHNHLVSFELIKKIYDKIK